MELNMCIVIYPHRRLAAMKQGLKLVKKKNIKKKDK